MPSRLKDLRLRFPYDDQDFREKYTPGHVSPSSLKYTGDCSKGPRAANASLKNNHPVFIFSHHDSDGPQNLFYVKRRTRFLLQICTVLRRNQRKLNMRTGGQKWKSGRREGGVRQAVNFHTYGGQGTDMHRQTDANLPVR